MKKRLLMLAAVSITTALLFGCSATVNIPEPGQDKEETSETGEEASSEQEDEGLKEESEKPAEEADEADEISGDITYEIKRVYHETKIDNFYGETDILEITDEGHKKLKASVDKWFEKYKSDFETQCSEFENEAEEAKKMFEEDNPDDESGYFPQYSLDYGISVSRADDQMLSVVMSEYSFTGGAHGGTYVHAVNFDTETGEVIENSEFDESAGSVCDYIIKTIEDSSEDSKEMLFPEWKDTIEGMFNEGMKDGSFWFDGRGMTYVFQQYDIAPYAAGIITFDIPYADMEKFPEKYVSDGSFYAVRITADGFGELIDVDGDGKEEKVYLETETDEDTYYSTYTVHVGDRELKFDEEGYYYCEPTYVHSTKGDYFMLVVTGDNDYNRIYMYDAEGDFEKIDELDGSFKIIEDGKAVVSQRHDAFGTWGIYKDYTYDSKGLHNDDKIVKIDNDPRTKDKATGITLKKDLKYTDVSGDYENTKVLEKGSVIYPVSDSGSELGFVTEDGEEGFFEYTRHDDEWGHVVDGVDEFDMFDDMPYAG